MLLLVTVAILQFITVLAGPCDDGTKFFPTAASCPNLKPDAFCMAIFKGSVENNALVTTLPAECTNKPSIAALCPKNCGFCCKQKEYNCENAKVSPLTCSAITQADCKNVALRELLVKYCPNVSGFCADNGCIDIAPGCAGQVPTICFSVDMQEFSKKNCRKSCAQCNSV